MSPRKRTIDDLDDVDDEDGMQVEELEAEGDLSLDVRDADEVGLGGTGSRMDLDDPLDEEMDDDDEILDDDLDDLDDLEDER